jgi:putative flippase GtrA
MSGRSWALLRRGLNSSLLRFLLVGGSGELLYLALFALGVRAGLSTLVAITLAGAICLIFNAVMHAHISFRVRFSRSLLARYGAIQLLGWLLSILAASMLGRLATSIWMANAALSAFPRAASSAFASSCLSR